MENPQLLRCRVQHKSANEITPYTACLRNLLRRTASSGITCFHIFTPATKNLNSHYSCDTNSAGTNLTPQQSLCPCDTNSAGINLLPQ